MKDPKQPPQKPKKSTNSSQALTDKLNSLGSLGKKTDRTNQKKIKSKPKSVVLIGGLQDAQRFYLMWGIMAVLFVVLFARAFWLQVGNAQFYINKADTFITTKRPMPVQRGMILDTNGLPLAANAPLVTVIFSPYDYALSYYETKRYLQKAQSQSRIAKLKEKLDKMNLAHLSKAVNVPQKTLEAWVKLDENVDVNDLKAVKAALPTGSGSRRQVLFNKTTPETAAAVLQLDFAGIFAEHHQQRFYLQPEPNASLVGYMSSVPDGKKTLYTGRSGIELKYNDQLSGQAGQMLMLRGSGSAIEEIKELKPKVDGENITLTIDSRLQFILYQELVELGRRQSALAASGIVVDVQTGDVLAMGSWPAFNPNNLKELSGTNERNRVIMDTVEPGSVVKPFTVAAALDSGKYNVNTLIHTSGSLTVGGRTISDAGNYGSITMGKLIQKSSNVASAKIALSLPSGAIAEMQQKFGFGKKTNLNLPSEAAGSVKPPSDVARRATLAYGYGQSVTLAQIAQAYATLGNNGVLSPLRLVKNDPKPEPIRVISEKHAQSIVTMMKSVTEEGGTGTAAAINGYHVAGKTGTSRRADPIKGGYIEGQYRNIFAGVAPASNPRFAVVILVEDPRKEKYAGQTVAPVFANVMKETLRLYNVPFDKPLDVSKE